MARMQLTYVVIAVFISTVHARYSQYQRTYQQYQPTAPASNKPYAVLSTGTGAYNGEFQYRQTMSHNNQHKPLMTNSAQHNLVTPWLVNRSSPVKLMGSTNQISAHNCYSAGNGRSNLDNYCRRYLALAEVNDRGYQRNTYYHNYANSAMHTYGNTATLNNHDYYRNTESYGMDMRYLPLLMDADPSDVMALGMLMNPGQSQHMLPYYMMESGHENMLPMLALSGRHSNPDLRQYIMLTMDRYL